MTKKFFIIIWIFLIMVCLIKPKTYANIIDPNTYKPGSTSNVADGEELGKIGNRIIGVIRVIGTGISVISLVIMGIKYMMGSVEEKAEYKKTMGPYAIGAVMVFGIVNILAIVEDIVGGF